MAQEARAQEIGSGFWDWFTAERKKRRLSVRAIELSGGTGTGWLYTRMTRGLPPTYDGSRIIAAAFGVPLDEVLRRAGLLPEGAEQPEIVELGDLARTLSSANLRTLLTVARALARTQEKVAEPVSYRVVGMSRQPWTLADWRAAIGGLTPEQRARLLKELNEEGFGRSEADHPAEDENPS